MIRIFKQATSSPFNIIRNLSYISKKNDYICYEKNKYEYLESKKSFPIEKCQSILSNDVVSVIGYGAQGRSQALNLKDNDINVILGLRENGNSWKKAVEDGWEPNKNLYDIDEASKRQYN